MGEPLLYGSTLAEFVEKARKICNAKGISLNSCLVCCDNNTVFTDSKIQIQEKKEEHETSLIFCSYCVYIFPIAKTNSKLFIKQNAVMRKYQQLCLVAISLISIIILLMYRSENSRLKYVLEVVNFFGRTDNAIIRLENTTKIFIQNYDLANPSPVWTRIGTDFHVFSSFWTNNTLKAGGLEAVSLVVGIGISNCLLKH